jgi:cytochrome o ubiquinol oxidase subunit II
MQKSKNGSVGRLVVRIVLAVIGLAVLIRVLLFDHNVALFNPKGLIAHEQHSLMVFTVVLLLVIAVPALVVLFFTASKYRESNTKAAYAPDARHGKLFDLSIWLIPSAFMQRVIAADTDPLTIQVVATRWKWLFIYPEQNIATVNFVQIPVHTPVEFELTADEAPMSSFWIPNLGGQLYAMTGMVNRLNLMADTPGDYTGISAEINGAGFAGMKFTARAGSRDDFDTWVQEAKLSPEVLDRSTYQELLQPREDSPVALYSSADKNLYDAILMKYMMSPEDHAHMDMNMPGMKM